MPVTIASFTFDYGRGSTGYLRSYADSEFFDPDGSYHPAQPAGGRDYLKEIPFNATSNVATVGAFTHPATWDEASGARSSVTIYILDANRNKVGVLVSTFRIPTLPATTTWGALLTYNTNAATIRDTDTYTKQQTNYEIEQHLLVGNPATTTTLGRVKTSVAPADAASPVAVGDNDPRVNLVYHVQDYGAVCDGVTDDSATVNALAGSVPEGSVIQFPARRCYVANLQINRQSNVTFRGMGMGRTVLVSNTPGGSVFTNVGSSVVPAEGVVVEDMTLELPALQTGISVNGQYLTNLTVRRVEARGGSFILADGVAGLTVEKCEGRSLGQANTAFIQVQGASKRVRLLYNDIDFYHSGILLLGTAGSIEDIVIAGNRHDGGWYYLPADFTGSGGSVSYTSTTVTHTGQTFAGFGSASIKGVVRALEQVGAGTGVFTNRNKMADPAATFVSDGLVRGDMIRVGSAFGIVADLAEDFLIVADWLNVSDLLPAPHPSGTYTTHKVYLGRVTGVTPTQLTVERWFDLAGASVTPSAGTRYEAQKVLPSYAGIHTEPNVRELWILGNYVRHSYADAISANGQRALVAFNCVQDIQDTGITLDDPSAEYATVIGNYINRCGAAGMYLGGNGRHKVTDNTLLDCFWLNNNPAGAGGILVYSSRNSVRGNTARRTTSPNFQHAVFVGGASATDNKITDNEAYDLLGTPFVADGAGATANHFRFNDGAFAETSGASGNFVVRAILRIVSTVNLVSVAAGVTAHVFSVPGAALGDVVKMTPPTNWPNDLILGQAFVSSTNNVTQVVYNPTGGAVPAPSGNWSFEVVKK